MHEFQKTNSQTPNTDPSRAQPNVYVFSLYLSLILCKIHFLVFHACAQQILIDIYREPT
eukprot:COSAG05_NODE_8_length_40675_cov_148.837539_25_plen_59_part_00